MTKERFWFCLNPVHGDVCGTKNNTDNLHCSKCGREAAINQNQQAAQDVLVHRDEFWRQSEEVMKRQAERLALDDPDRLLKHRLQTDMLDKMRRVYMLAEHLAISVLPANVVAREFEAQV